jgi:hypothetical protein
MIGLQSGVSVLAVLHRKFQYGGLKPEVMKNSVSMTATTEIVTVLHTTVRSLCDSRDK